MKCKLDAFIAQFQSISLLLPKLFTPLHSRQSLEELKPIFQEIVQIKSSTEGIPIMLVGNKCDEVSSREVTTNEGTALSKLWKSAFMETSAKTNHNVQELFQELLQLEKRRTMTLQLDSKKTSSRFNTDRFKGKCVLMWPDTLESNPRGRSVFVL